MLPVITDKAALLLDCECQQPFHILAVRERSARKIPLAAAQNTIGRHQGPQSTVETTLAWAAGQPRRPDKLTVECIEGPSRF
jgi:hypothetical protein